jgi:hypothetical protein
MTSYKNDDVNLRRFQKNGKMDIQKVRISAK